MSDIDLEAEDTETNLERQSRFDSLIGSNEVESALEDLQSENESPQVKLQEEEEQSEINYSGRNSQDIRTFMQKSKQKRRLIRQTEPIIVHDLSSRSIMPRESQDSPVQQKRQKKPSRNNNKISRDQALRMAQEAEEAEREALKRIMIAICTFIEENYKDQIQKITLERSNNIHYDLNIDLLQFLYFFPFEGSRFHDYPKEFLKFLKQCLIAVQSKIISQETDQTIQPFMILKRKVNIRLINIPPMKEISIGSIRNVRQCHVNKYMVLYGTVVRAQTVKNRETKKDFACKNCGKIYTANSDIYEFSSFKLPPICGGQVEKRPNPFQSYIQNMRKRRGQGQGDDGQQQGPNGMMVGNCNNRFFVPVHGTAQYKDYQEIKIQEVYKTLKPGMIPRSIIVILEDNLVDVVKPGDDVMISGMFIQRWRPPFISTVRPDIEVAVLANNITVLNKRDFNIKQEINQQACSDFKKYWKDHETKMLEGKNKVLESIAPHIYDRYAEKLGLLLALIGGVPKQQGDDPRIRGQIHMLMIGEPGTGKSQLLQFAQKISMRSVHTTGIGTTSAGLTVAAFKDGNDWILEAGALVLADCGLCCIDEFGLIKPEDRGSVHEAMEQQTISIAKAGICCKINTRATILAATNPCRTQKWNNRYDNNQNTGIATSLLSRFDLIFILVDEQITEQDLAQANFKLAFSRQEDDMVEENKVVWSTERLLKYIVFVQRYIDPVCVEEAEMIFQAYFGYLRGRQTLAKDRKTIRMLESLIRLAEAHARLMFRKEIEIYDAVCVIVLMEKCVSTGLFEIQYSCLMSREMYSQAKTECLTKLGLDPFYFKQDDFDIGYTDNNQRNHQHSRRKTGPNEDVTEFLVANETYTNTHTHTHLGGIDKTIDNIVSEFDNTHLNAPTVVVLDSQSSQESKTPEKLSPIQSELPFGSETSLKPSGHKINLDEFKFDEGYSQLSSVVQSASKVYRLREEEPQRKKCIDDGSDTEDDFKCNVSNQLQQFQSKPKVVPPQNFDNRTRKRRI